MSNFKHILLKLCARQDLTREEAAAAFEQMLAGSATDAQVGGLLVGLASKGSTVDELVGAATSLRGKLVPVACDHDAGVVIDTCGTGGDVRGTFNISTAAAIIVAAAGVRVVKHGNRSASSRVGSADVLEALGVNIEANSAQQQACLREAKFCFAFARHHSPAMKHVAAARGALGIPTIFNLLGPLTNPAGARHQLIGVFAPELTEKLAAVLRELGSTRAWIVHAEDGLDELSTMAATRITELHEGQVRTTTLDPRTLGLKPPRLEDLQVSTAAESAAMIREVIEGKPGPARDIALLNAAAALVIADAAADLSTGMQIAADAVDSARTRETLAQLINYSREN